MFEFFKGPKKNDKVEQYYINSEIISTVLTVSIA